MAAWNQPLFIEEGLIAIMQDDSNFDLPPARKTPSGDPLSAPFTPGGDPWSAPLSPDHVPPTGPYNSASGPWGDYAGNTPYGSPTPGYAPPPPPGRPRPGMTSPQQRRRRNWTILSLATIVLLVSGGVTWLFTHDGNSTTTSTPGGPVAVATDKPTATATLKPGQTALPTKVPTATAQPTAPPGQPTFTPVPTSTPVPYASHATVHFMRTTKNVNVNSTVLAATSGGNVSATQYTPAVSQVPSASIDADFTPGQGFTVTLTVTNHSTTTAITSSGKIITSVSGNVTCALQGSVTVPKSNHVQQTCQTPAQHFPADTWDDKTVITNLEYTGSNTAQGSDPFWSVPSACATTSANLSAAHTATQSALQAKLNATVSGTAFYGPIFSFNDSSATCSPTANTTESSDFSFTVAINGSAVETTYAPSTVIAYQQNALKNAVAALPPSGSYALLSPQVCLVPTPGASTPTSISLTCTAKGTAAWIWNSGNEATLANLINGESKSAALSALNSVQGIVSSSVSITLTGGTFVPLNTSAISFTVS